MDLVSSYYIDFLLAAQSKADQHLFEAISILEQLFGPLPRDSILDFRLMSSLGTNESWQNGEQPSPNRLRQCQKNIPAQKDTCIYRYMYI